MSAGIFISYRREDSAGHAGRLYDRLSEHFGEDQVFMDLAIAPGAAFAQMIESAVASCGALIALIGDEWLDAQTASGERRLDDPRDFVRLEISSALERGIPVIPVLVHGARMPRAEELPEPLAELSERNAIELSDARWNYDTGRLVKALGRVLRPGLAGRASATLGWLRRRPLLAGSALIAPAGLAALAVILVSGEAERGGASTIDVGRGPDGILAHLGSVWVANSGEGTVSRIDAKRGRVVKTIRVGQEPDSVAVGDGSIWVTNTGDGTVSRIDEASGRLQTRSIRVGRQPEGIAVGGGSVWVVNSGDDSLTELDPDSNRTVGEDIPIGREPRDVDVGEGAVWVTDRDGRVHRIDPGTRRPVGPPIRVGAIRAALRGLRVDLGAVWVANARDGTVVQIDPRQGRQVGSAIAVGARPVGLALGGGSIWVGNRDGDQLIEIDIGGRQVAEEPIAVGERPVGVAVGAGAVWVANHGSGTVTRVGL